MPNDSSLRSEYMRQRRRIQDFTRKARKRGYNFNVDPGHERIPENITQADIDRLKSYTPDRLYSDSTRAFYSKDEITGEVTDYQIMSGLDARKRERSEAGRRGYEHRQEALKYNFDNVQEYDDYTNKNKSTQTVDPLFMEEYTPVKENKPAKELSITDRYAILLARQYMPEEYAQDHGFQSVEDAIQNNLNFITGWYKWDYPNMPTEAKRTSKEWEQRPPTGMTPEDDEAAEGRRAEREADWANADSGIVLEQNIVMQTLEQRMGRYGTSSGETLRKMLQQRINKQGERSVAEAFNQMEAEGLPIWDYLDDLAEAGSESPGVLNRSIRAIYNAVKDYGENGEINASNLSKVMEGMEDWGWTPDYEPEEEDLDYDPYADYPDDESDDDYGDW